MPSSSETQNALSPAKPGLERFVVFQGYCILAGLAWTSAGGAKIKWQLPERNDLDYFDKGRIRRKRKGAAPRYYLTVHDSDGVSVWRADEVMFLGSNWNDSNGAIVTFELPDVETLLEYRVLKVSADDSTGDTRLLTVIQVGDDEKLVNQELAEIDDPVMKGGAKARHAGRLCREPDFQEFVFFIIKPGLHQLYTREMERAHQLELDGKKEEADKVMIEAGAYRVLTMQNTTEVEREKAAAEFVRQKCQIKSRAELDHNAAAAHRYNVFVEGPFIRYWSERRRSTHRWN